ncbi:MAG TPA: alkaline phosphatase family protein [Pseudonocardia sp.]|nr:alkaline phosphatase family protein [Pseudonocardia sp.]
MTHRGSRHDDSGTAGPAPPAARPAAAGRARHSLADVVPALLRALGEPGVDAGPDIAPVRAAALLLIDGLGAQLLRAHAADAPFLAALPDAGPLRTGFPSSTTISLASLGTGLPPGTHGMVGISFRAGPGALLDSLPWTSRVDGRAVDMRERFPPESVQPLPTLFERAAAAGITVRTVSQAAFAGSGLTRAVLRGGEFRGTRAMGDLAAEVIDAVTGPGRRLCYGYHADLDSIGHRHGPGSLAWRLQLAQVDRLAALITEHLPSDAVLAITGDHGMVLANRIHDFDTDEDLQRGVALLGGDPRARLVYAHPGATADVLAAWRAALGAHAWVVPSEQAIDEGWFGSVTDAVRDRIGDIVVAARGTAAVVRTVAEPFIATMPGQHGSLSNAEQLVPLLLATSDT